MKINSFNDLLFRLGRRSESNVVSSWHGRYIWPSFDGSTPDEIKAFRIYSIRRAIRRNLTCVR